MRTTLNKIAVLFVALGAISYGVPATIYKLALTTDIHIGAILCFVFIFGSLFLILADTLLPLPNRDVFVPISFKQKCLIMASGSTIGLTNLFYLLSLKHTSVAICAVMMMQSVWLTIAIRCLLERRLPSFSQGVVVLFILIGTVLATDVLHQKEDFSLLGAGLAFLSGFFYALTIQFTGNLARNVKPILKSKLMTIGAMLLVLVVWGKDLVQEQHLLLASQYGLITAIFAVLIPLSCLSFFMPKLPSGVGEILTSLELPAAIILAWIVLNEQINLQQGVGIVIIIVAASAVNVLGKKTAD